MESDEAESATAPASIGRAVAAQRRACHHRQVLRRSQGAAVVGQSRSRCRGRLQVASSRRRNRGCRWRRSRPRLAPYSRRGLPGCWRLTVSPVSGASWSGRQQQQPDPSHAQPAMVEAGTHPLRPPQQPRLEGSNQRGPATHALE
jgi:hypothetical protein